MAERVVYSCDWCCVDAPSSGSIGESWVVLDDVGTKPEGVGKAHLCGPCHNARLDALKAARKARFRETHPLQTSQPGGEVPR